MYYGILEITLNRLLSMYIEYNKELTFAGVLQVILLLGALVEANTKPVHRYRKYLYNFVCNNLETA